MDRPTLRVLQDEHHALLAMLQSVQLLLDDCRRHDRTPPFDVLRAMLFYLDEFPERLHHRKESELLFPAVRRRSAEAADTLDRLERDHQTGEHAIRDLEHTLLAYEMMGASRREAFEGALRRYAAFYREHMHLEEHVVLPLARRVLTDDDWRALDEAFARNRDPLTGHTPDAPYAALFQRIVTIAPAPVGLGS